MTAGYRYEETCQILTAADELIEDSDVFWILQVPLPQSK